MPNTAKNILFLCTGNSARSILAEAIVNHDAPDRFRGYSAGSQPSGTPNPYAIALLDSLGHDTNGLSSKSWDAFAGPDAPQMDLIITVCDNAAGETCPFWPGQPVSAHWGLPDPAAVTGSDAEIAQAFADTYRRMRNRIQALLALPAETLDAPDLNQTLARIGQMDDAAAANNPQETPK